MTWSMQQAEQQRVDQPDEARRQDRRQDDDDLDPVRLEEGHDPAEGPGPALLGDRREVGSGAAAGPPPMPPAAAATAAARGPARRRPRLAPWKPIRWRSISFIVTLPTLPRNVRVALGGPVAGPRSARPGGCDRPRWAEAIRADVAAGIAES